MSEDKLNLVWEKSKLYLLKAADRMPLVLHYALNGILLVTWAGDLIIPDVLPFIDEGVLTVAAWYYNAYILRRTFGVINPLRILKGQTPAAKRKRGMLPYEQQLEAIKSRLKTMRKTAKESPVPGLARKNVDQLTDRVKQIETRLTALDKLLSSPAFQEGQVKLEIARIEARRDMEQDPALKAEYSQALEHARSHLANIDRLFEERNRLVARLERFHLQLDNTYSQIVAMGLPQAATKDADTERLFNELFTAVNAFDVSLQELSAKPAPDLYQAAVKEVEQTEAKIRERLAPREPDKSR